MYLVKKLLSTISYAALFSVSALAADTDKTNPFEGAYVGASVGYNSYDLNNIDDNAKGVNLGVFTGYRAEVFDNIILGAEVFYNKEFANIDFIWRNNKWSNKVQYTYGIDAKLGTVLGGNLYYLSAGYGKASYRVTTELLTGFDIHKFDGIRFGLGGEFIITDNFNARVQANYQKLDKDNSLGLSFGLIYNF